MPSPRLNEEEFLHMCYKRKGDLSNQQYTVYEDVNIQGEFKFGLMLGHGRFEKAFKVTTEHTFVVLTFKMQSLRYPLKSVKKQISQQSITIGTIFLSLAMMNYIKLDCLFQHLDFITTNTQAPFGIPVRCFFSCFFLENQNTIQNKNAKTVFFFCHL